MFTLYTAGPYFNIIFISSLISLVWCDAFKKIMLSIIIVWNSVCCSCLVFFHLLYMHFPYLYIYMSTGICKYIYARTNIIYTYTHAYLRRDWQRAEDRGVVPTLPLSSALSYSFSYIRVEPSVIRELKCYSCWEGNCDILSAEQFTFKSKGREVPGHPTCDIICLWTSIVWRVWVCDSCVRVLCYVCVCVYVCLYVCVALCVCKRVVLFSQTPFLVHEKATHEDSIQSTCGC